jgi:hypothetical protein
VFHWWGFFLTDEQGLIAWCSNNWRMTGGGTAKARAGRRKQTDLVWETRKEECLEEISRLMGVDEATTSTPGWFKFRTKAAKAILARMTKEERAEVKTLSLKEGGRYSEKQQRR